MLEAPSTIDTLVSGCIHCGLCLDTCPTYLETGNEAQSPRGRLLLMSGLDQGRFRPESGVRAALDSCLGCRACETACPSGVAYGRILIETRDDLRKQGMPSRSRGERFLVRHVLWRGTLLELWGRGYRGLRLWVLLSALARFIPHKATRRRLSLLPRPEPRPADRPHSVAEGATEEISVGEPLVLVRGCVARTLFPESERAIVTLLEAAGYRVTLLDDPACCGAMAHHIGEGTLARRLSAAMIETLASTAGPIVFTAAGCGAYGKEFAESSDHPRGAAVANRVRDLTEVLVEPPRPLRFKSKSGDPAVAFQDPCHLRHGLGVVGPPRNLLSATGARLVDLPEADVCCGSAGTYNIGCIDSAWSLGRRKRALICSAGVETVITANPGCAIQLQTHLRESGIQVSSLPVFSGEKAPRIAVTLAPRRKLSDHVPFIGYDRARTGADSIVRSS